MAHETTIERAAVQDACIPRARARTGRAVAQEKARLLASGKVIYQCLAALEDAGESGDAGARLLGYAEGKMLSFLKAFERSPLTNITSFGAISALNDVQSFLEGCQALESGKPRAALADAPVAQLAQLVAELDNCKWPTESYQDGRARDFMAGKALAVDMLEKGEALGEDEHTAHLEACYRGRGVPQDVFVRPYFDRIEEDPALRDGFMAVLAEAVVDGYRPNPQVVLGMTYLECVGGPETRYMSEDGVEPICEGATSTEAGNVDPPPRGNLRILWQLAMDEITNTSVHDPAEGIDKVIAILDAMQPHLSDESAPEATQGDEEDGRHLLALRASWEIEGLANLVHDQIADDVKGLPLRSMLRRTSRLACIIMSAIDDEVEPLEHIEQRFAECTAAG